MKQGIFRIEFGNEWPFEWHEFYKCINLFQVYVHNDGEGSGLTLFLFNYWICFKINKKKKV